jgi:hypothetical protein
MKYAEGIAGHSDGTEAIRMANRLKPYFENTTEAGVACIVTMVQGDLLSLTATHWFYATQTGLVAGTITATALLLTKIRREWMVSLALGAITMVVDYFVHPGMLGSHAIIEAVVTGLGAAALSYVVARTFRALGRLRVKRASA